MIPFHCQRLPKTMKLCQLISALLLLTLIPALAQPAPITPPPQSSGRPSRDILQCVAFSPYVGQLSPDYGAQPAKELIDTLLDRLIEQTPFRCIMTYGVINGLDYVFSAAKARQLKVIAIIWLDKDTAINSQSITAGINAARAFPDTLIKLSCGSEVRTRHGYAFDGEISRCIQAMREAKIKQPVTTIDIWWEWCNRDPKCEPTSFSKQVDWIGINVHPWWENRFSGLYTCISAGQAADFIAARLQQVQKANPDKEIIVTEFGWPSGPKGPKGKVANQHTGEQCGIASPENQALVIRQTFKKLAEKNYSGVAFEAFSEDWKPSDEENFGKYWGLCQGGPPYECRQNAFD